MDTAELEKNGLTPHPDKIAEAAALSSVTLPKTDYKLALPAHVLFSEVLIIDAFSVTHNLQVEQDSRFRAHGVR